MLTFQYLFSLKNPSPYRLLLLLTTSLLTLFVGLVRGGISAPQTFCPLAIDHTQLLPAAEKAKDTELFLLTEPSKPSPADSDLY